MTFKVYIIAILCVFTSSIYAQKTIVSGQIKDKANHSIPYANIVLKNTIQQEKVIGVMTDENGMFELVAPQGKYLLTITAINFTIKTITIEYSKRVKKQDLGVIIMDESLVDLDAVVINGTKSSYKMSLDKKVYTVSDDIIAKGGTLSDVLQNLPSVQIESEGSISIRGDQNVTILIDNKPSGLASTAELYNTIPASAIAKIEVIVSPSAKYAASETGGIINVILKKGQKKNNATSIEVFSGYRINSGLNANINRRGEKGSWYINGGLGYAEPQTKNNLSLLQWDEILDKSEQDSERNRKQFYAISTLGGDVKLNKKNYFGGSITYRKANANNNNWTSYKDFNQSVLLSQSRREEIEDEKSVFIEGSIDYEFKFNDEGHQIEFNALGAYDKDNEDISILSTKEFPVISFLNQDITDNTSRNMRYVFTVDYTNQLSNNNNNIAFGGRSNFSKMTNTYDIHRFLGTQWELIPELTGNTQYKEMVSALYGQYSKKWQKISLKFGLRTEQSSITISDQQMNSSISKKYTDVFPTAFLGYKIDEKNNFKLSLTKRVNRPSNWMITPFSSFTDERNIFKGNTAINPSYVLGAELAYEMETSNRLQFYPSLYYRNTSDEMEFFVEKKSLTVGGTVQDVFVSTIANIGNYIAYGTEIGVVYKPYNWWRMYGELLLNGFTQRGNYKGASFNGEGLMVSGRYNIKFTILKSVHLQVQNYYKGPITTGQYKRKGFYTVNIGLSKTICKGNGTLALNAKDVFNSNIRKIITYGVDFERELSLQYRRRQINVSFSYQFNQKQYKGEKGSQYDNYEIIN